VKIKILASNWALMLSALTVPASLCIRFPSSSNTGVASFLSWITADALVFAHTRLEMKTHEPRMRQTYRRSLRRAA